MCSRKEFFTNTDSASSTGAGLKMNYQDVKTKTLNWCDKMQKVGLLNPDQFNQCVATFKDTTAGLLPKEFATPQTGMARNYSLYNTKSKTLTPELTGDNTDTIMLSTVDGLTLACKPDNSIYLVSNINDPKVNQKELYFTLVPQNENVYAILSPYGKYLIVQTDYTANFTGTSIGPMASWNIIKVDRVGTTAATVLVEALQYSNFHMLYDNASQGLKIVYGNADNMLWIMNTKLQVSGEDSNNFIGAEYIVTKENIIQKMKANDIQKICLTSQLTTYKKLYRLVSNNFNNIISYVNNKLLNDQNTFRLSSLDYQTRLNSITQNSMLNDTARASLVANIPQPSGLNITNDDISNAINKITNAKNAFLINLQNTFINSISQKLKELNDNSIEIDYNNFLVSLNNELNDVTNRINQNNDIMSRQKDTYTKFNKEYADNITKQKKIENVDDIANANIEIINNFSQQTSYINKLYPFGLFILALILFYLSYITFIKFKENVYKYY
jgi:hypothetical protein